MNNSDVKIIASASNRKLHPLVKKVSPIQRGFVPGRQFLDNIVEADAASRKYSIMPNADPCRPCFLSMDIAAAFPSLRHDWLWEVLRRRGIHGRFLTLLCYHMPIAFLELGGTR